MTVLDARRAARDGRRRPRRAAPRRASPTPAIDALLVTHLPNVRYLTGFTGSAAMLLVTDDALVFTSDGRYRTQAGEQLGAAGVDARIEIGATVAQQREALARRARRPAHGSGSKPTRSPGRSSATFAERARRPRARRRPTAWSSACAGSRSRARSRASAPRARSPTTRSARCSRRLADGPTERDFALELEVEMRRRGASGNSFDPIVASGPNGGEAARPPDATGRSSAGELVVIDFGCIVDGYCSDMTRTVSVGDPGPDARRVWDVVRESQRAGRDAVARRRRLRGRRPRVPRRDRRPPGWADAFVHGTGHGVGLEIHEAPRVAASARDTLEPGSVVTVEPGVYLPGVGGVRIEDTVVVTPDGSDPLTAFPKELIS